MNGALVWHHCSMTLPEIKRRLQKLASKETAKDLQWFFKTGPGEYGEGDVFIGIKIPPLRKLAAEFEDEPLKTVKTLLKSKIHEERTLALMILVRQFARADEQLPKADLQFLSGALPIHQQLGPGGWVGSVHCWTVSLEARSKTTLPSCKVDFAVGKAHRHSFDVLFHTPE